MPRSAIPDYLRIFIHSLLLARADAIGSLQQQPSGLMGAQGAISALNKHTPGQRPTSYQKVWSSNNCLGWKGRMYRVPFFQPMRALLSP